MCVNDTGISRDCHLSLYADLCDPFAPYEHNTVLNFFTISNVE